MSSIPSLPDHRSKTLTQNEVETIAAQLQKPSGALAQEIAQKMSLSNRDLIDRVYRALQAKSKEVLLEIGPGNGAYLSQLLENLGPEGQLHLLDHSADMLETLAVAYAKEVSAQEIVLKEQALGALDYPEQFFDGICSSNTLYFWADPELCLKELKRVLKPQGRLVLGIRSRQAVEKMPFTQYGFRLYSASELVHLLESNGFEIACLEREWSEEVDNLTVRAIRARF